MGKKNEQEKDKIDKESPLPLLNVSDDIEQDDPFETLEKKGKKKPKSGFFDDNLFGDDEDEDGRDIFASMVSRKNKGKKIEKKKTEVDNLFDSDDDGDDLFAIEKEAD